MPDFPADASALTHLIVVSDLDRARDWYSQILGAEITGEYGGTSIVLKLLGNWLLLVTPGGPTADKPSVTMAPPADPDRPATELIFRVEDANHSYAVLKSRGAEFLTPPVKNGIETRAFFRDPDGHLFEISSLEQT